MFSWPHDSATGCWSVRSPAQLMLMEVDYQDAGHPEHFCVACWRDALRSNGQIPGVGKCLHCGVPSSTKRATLARSQLDVVARSGPVPEDPGSWRSWKRSWNS